MLKEWYLRTVSWICVATALLYLSRSRSWVACAFVWKRKEEISTFLDFIIFLHNIFQIMKHPILDFSLNLSTEEVCEKSVHFLKQNGFNLFLEFYQIIRIQVGKKQLEFKNPRENLENSTHSWTHTCLCTFRNSLSFFSYFLLAFSNCIRSFAIAWVSSVIVFNFRCSNFNSLFYWNIWGTFRNFVVFRIRIIYSTLKITLELSGCVNNCHNGYVVDFEIM